MKNLKEKSGITLIALVITIIILLILAGVTISALSGDNGILSNAAKAKEETEKAEIIEQIQLELYGEMADNNGQDLTQEDIEKVAEKYGDITGENFEDKVLITDKGKYEIKLSEIWEETAKGGTTGGVNIEDIFDPTGKEEGKLHVGDFVNYTAGIWTQDDMDKIAASGAKIPANNSTSLPTQAFGFGGFTVGSSKDGNATPFDATYNYVKDKETGEAITGWRLFDVDDEGRMILISAGCPEDYYHSGITNYGYISEYILSENINSNATNLDLGLGTKYTPRNWSMYENATYGDTRATILTKEKLDDWYTRYITEGVAANTYIQATFQKIYKTSPDVVNDGRYESLIDNYSYYWLSSSYADIGVSYIEPGSQLVYNYRDYALGIRILVSLPSDIQIIEESTGTKTLVSRDNEYTYNVWNLQ